VAFALEKFRHYLDGNQFDLITDHCPLCFINHKEKLTPKLHRWAVLFSEFNFVIKHKKGTLNADADCLSRNPVGQPLAEQDDERLFAFASIDLMDRIRRHQQEDPMIAKILNETQQGKSSPFVPVHGLLYRIIALGKRLYVPTSLRSEFLFAMHDSLESDGHFGVAKTLEKMRERYYWPGMTHDIQEYIRTCDSCQRNKYERRKPAGLMEPIITDRPFQMVGIDIVGPFVASEGNRYIIVATDYFTK
jgi:hypothetical protein